MTPDEVHAAVARFWDFSRVLPEPIHPPSITCPVCGRRPYLIRGWRFHQKHESPTRYRCDVMMKCTVCSATWTHGVVVPKDVYLAATWGGTMSYDRRTGEEFMRRVQTSEVNT